MDLKTIISDIYPLSKAGYNKFEEIVELVRIPKNSLIIKGGIIDNSFYFMKEGIARAYYLTKDREINLIFSGPGESILSINSYTYQKPGYEYMETLTACELYQIDTKQLMHLYQTDIELANWGRKFAEVEFIKAEERLMSKLFKSATERYDELLQKDPLLPHKIKLGHIASYLGVSQVTLSRIRAQIR